MRQYKWTISVVVVLLAAVAIHTYRWNEQGECEDRGGVYVQTYTGFKCAGATP